MATLIYFILYFAILNSCCDAYKALVVTMMPSRSHAILVNGVVKRLLDDGYEVTYIRSIEYENAPPALRQIDVSSNKDVIPDAVFNIQSLMNKDVEGNSHEYIKRIMTDISVNTLENKGVQTLINDPNEHFDVVIVEFLENDLLASLSTLFNCPLIWLSPLEITSDIMIRIDKIPNPAYNIDYLSKNVIPFIFQQRVSELWARVKAQILTYWYFDVVQVETYNRLIAPLIVKRGRQPPAFDEIRYNASLVLGYSHVSMEEAASLPQNYKHVGGYHIDEDIKPLPNDLKTIMDKAKNGVIYFSMGSNLKSKDFPDKTKRDLLKMFGKLKQTVLWKFEEQLSNVPKNVYVSNWFPQLSILSHSNIAIFITHGGLLSTTETLHFGVPIIGIPGFADQYININRAVSKGFGLKVEMTYNLVADLEAAIEIVTTNSSYHEKAKEFSFIFHDRPVKPSNELSHWVRHVVKTRGALHLRSPALSLPLYQRLYLDLGVLILILLVLVFNLLKVTYSKICSNKESSKKSGKEKKNI